MTEINTPQSTRIAEVKPVGTITPPEPQLSQLMTRQAERDNTIEWKWWEDEARIRKSPP